ncbi:MAG: leucine-rich repeat domain-containing protein [Patescibacteria group bacterium]
MTKKIFLSAFLISSLFVMTGCAFRTPIQEENSEKREESGKRLDLSNKNLSKLPADVLRKVELEELDISDNGLTGALPAEIGQLQNLRVLDASNNRMTGVPAEIGQLQKLETLDLSDNQITGLPYELGNLKKLKTLRLSGNDYSTQDLEKIRQNLPDLIIE